MEKRWVMKEPGDPRVVEQLSQDLNINMLLAELLAQRDIKTFDEAKKFFRPELSDLHDPFLMKDMEKAVLRLTKAIIEKEKILIYGDYDVDGTTAVALAFSFISQHTEHIEYYIPDRYTEGYGVSLAGIDHAHAHNCTLIIALDCGIKAVSKVAYAAEKNIDFIICDHHTPGAQVPDAVAILDPKQSDCQYPFKELSGCGLGFKLMEAYTQFHNLSYDALFQYLDLVAISIAADIVPIIDENRVLTYHGLRIINNAPRPGIAAIFALANVKKEITVNDLVFIIAPRINAAGRISSGKKAVALLLADNMDTANNNSRVINDHNLERKTLDLTITEQALEMMRDNTDMHTRKSTVLYHEDWHKGVLGIVASRLTEKFYRPTIVLTCSNGVATGSARSVKNFNVYNAIENCSDLLEQFGGHMYAAGLTLKVENVPAFVQRFEEVVSGSIEENMLTQEFEIDQELDPVIINQSTFNVLKQFAPFGPGNLSPIFVSKGVCDSGAVRIVGSDHLKMGITHPSLNKTKIDAIAFQMGHHLPYVSSGKPFDICYHIEENTFNGRTTLQMMVKDIKYNSAP